MSWISLRDFFLFLFLLRNFCLWKTNLKFFSLLGWWDSYDEKPWSGKSVRENMTYFRNQVERDACSTRFSHCHSLTIQIEIKKSTRDTPFANCFKTIKPRFIFELRLQKTKTVFCEFTDFRKTDFPLHRTDSLCIDGHDFFWGYGNYCTEEKEKYSTIGSVITSTRK